MPASLLDGTATAALIREELRPRVQQFIGRAGRPPSLAVLMVGDHPSSRIYVRHKQAVAAELGMTSELIELPASVSLDTILNHVARFNTNPEVDGILVQSPLLSDKGERSANDERHVFDAIDPAKDVDGLHSMNLGRLVHNRATLTPCTPSGVMELLTRSGIPLAGSHAVVLGRSEIVGKPMALLLLHHDATVTVCHSKTANLRAITRTADVLIVAIGRPAFVTADFIQPGATVVDVGINRVTDAAVARQLFERSPARLDAFLRRGEALVGDVHPSEGPEVAGRITPVPGGVGPLTVALLMKNTLIAAEELLRQRSAANSPLNR